MLKNPAIGHTLRRFVLAGVLALLAVLAATAQPAETEKSGRIVLQAALEGPIGPASARHIEKVLTEAGERSAQAIVLRIDTPGGLADTMRVIISEILESPVPVIGYVAPGGAHAASAGTYILYATHVAAMAPGTNLGAATPVAIGGMPEGLPGSGSGKDGNADDGTGEAEDGGSSGSTPSSRETMAAKATNDAVALIRSLAQMHGRNAEWAEKAVREAASLSAAEALDANVIDVVAADVQGLLEAIDGQSVSVRGNERRLATAGLPVEVMEADALTRLLGILSNPNVALILMMIGVYGLVFEFWNPGAGVPGVVGAISLTLGLYALNQLPLDYAGLALLILGIGFMVAEAVSPSFGVLGLGGLAAFIFGSAMLIDTEIPAFRVDWWLIGILVATSAAFLILLVGATIRAYRKPSRTGPNPLTGAAAKVTDWSGGQGHVFLAGERWNAIGPPTLQPGDSVMVEKMSGLTLIVRAVPGDAAPGDGPGAGIHNKGA
ncbi:MAG: serine protease [Phyllobacteriaceae bacterium]|nr:serine protease [Phyllobacteriaceae bacterium]MBA92816.1 serine protease [Phyllobacteriaceae bacterium]